MIFPKFCMKWKGYSSGNIIPAGVLQSFPPIFLIPCRFDEFSIKIHEFLPPKFQMFIRNLNLLKKLIKSAHDEKLESFSSTDLPLKIVRERFFVFKSM